MTEQLTVHEWEAVLRGACTPSDMLRNETTARYVHRKFEALIKERDQLQEDKNGLLEDFEGCL
ncbi:hypothetical protein D3C75_817340 [compost metagenome]